MNGIVAVLMLCLALLILLSVETQVIDVAKANPMGMKPGYTLVKIQSPGNNSHYSNPVIVNFTAEERISYISQDSPPTHNIYYKIDNDNSQESRM